MMRKIVGISAILIASSMVAFGIYGIVLGAVPAGIFFLSGGLVLISIGRSCLEGDKVQDLIDRFFYFMP